MEKQTNGFLITKFFEADGGRKFTAEEFRRLSKGDREELGALAAEALEAIEKREMGLVKIEADQMAIPFDESSPAASNGE